MFSRLCNFLSKESVLYASGLTAYLSTVDNFSEYPVSNILIGNLAGLILTGLIPSAGFSFASLSLLSIAGYNFSQYGKFKINNFTLPRITVWPDTPKMNENSRCTFPFQEILDSSPTMVTVNSEQPLVGSDLSSLVEQQCGLDSYMVNNFKRAILSEDNFSNPDFMKNLSGVLLHSKYENLCKVNFKGSSGRILSVAVD